MVALIWIVLFVAALMVLAYQRASMLVSTIGLGVLLLILSFLGHAPTVVVWILWIIFIALAIPLNILPLRRAFITLPILKAFQKVMPHLSATEQEALTAGDVGWTGDLFSGNPDWDKLQAMPIVSVSEEEQAFLDGPVEKLCTLLNDWDIMRTMTIPDEVWNHIKEHHFFGMIIPKKYGGLEFSATAHSQVITRIAGVNVAVASCVSVPNSLGPAELLLEYGTDEQKNHYLPRLAKGDDIPCFALTSPVAGSDASAIVDYGVVLKHEFDGQEQLCIKLNWNKRYITLAPLATLLGLAFKLYDPDHLLGEQEEIGITCALIPTTTKGVVHGRRHFPLHCAFPNGPTQGQDVIIPVSWIIGGAKMAGHGWRMLMECLAAGRSISLPSMVCGGIKRAAVASGAYARIRRQFNTAIGDFGGVGEVLARMTGFSYMADALRLFTVGVQDQGLKPVVESAISKYHCTELARYVITDAMDVHGGKGICMGPNNYLAMSYITSPISITVEGANILTRSMIIFGQGAIRSHPFMLNELMAAQESDMARFDKALFGHAGYLFSNKVRTFILGLTNGVGAKAPRGPLRRYFQMFSRFSAAFALVADFTMVTLGAELKRREKISARLGDLLSLLYMGSAVLKHYENGGSNQQELPVVEWCCQELLFQLQTRFDELFNNLPSGFVAGSMRALVFPLGKRLKAPSDKLGSQVAKLLSEPGRVRQRLAENTYHTKHANNIIERMEGILQDVIAVAPIEHKIVKARYKGEINGKNLAELTQAAQQAGIITESEATQMMDVDAKRMSIINVDDFAPEEILR